MVATDDMTKEEREEYWALVFEEYHESGLCKTEYCRKRTKGTYLVVLPVPWFYFENRVVIQFVMCYHFFIAWK